MKIIRQLSIVVIAASTFLFTSCELDGGESLNGASTSSIFEDLSRGELPQALSGVLSDMRVSWALDTNVHSIFGREYYFFSSSEPRWEGDVTLGNLDNNTFYSTGVWGARYATIKDINIILDGLGNTTADFTAQEIAATQGLLNTLKAHEYLVLTNNQYDNGIRFDVTDPDNLGGFVDHQSALTQISDILNAAATDLAAGGEAFPFNLTSGYSGFDTPQDFLEFNRALAARVETYRGNAAAALSALDASFLDLNGDLNTGVYHTFSQSGADTPNPLFIALNQTAIVAVAQSSFLTDAVDGDTRINKVVLRDAPREASGLVGTHDVALYSSLEDMVPILRNEELILLYAEANITTNPTEAVSALDILRLAAGLPAYTGPQTPAALQDELLYNRRYSLFGEGHRWVDMRRFDRLDELPNDRATDKVPVAIPIPATENQ